jgi:hypothetical protein
VATIHLSGYSGSNQNWALFNNNISTARSGLGDSGITGGIRIPFATEMMKSCRENAQAFVKRNNLKMISDLVQFCGQIQNVGVDVADNDFQAAFPDFKLCKSVRLVAKDPGTSQNPDPKGGPENGITPQLEREKFDFKGFPKDGINFGPTRAPVIETFPIRNR